MRTSSIPKPILTHHKATCDPCLHWRRDVLWKFCLLVLLLNRPRATSTNSVAVCWPIAFPPPPSRQGCSRSLRPLVAERPSPVWLSPLHMRRLTDIDESLSSSPTPASSNRLRRCIAT